MGVGRVLVFDYPRVALKSGASKFGKSATAEVKLSFRQKNGTRRI